MAMNRVQFQKGRSMTEFNALYGNEDACRAAVERAHWPHGLSQVPASRMPALRAHGAAATADGGHGGVRAASGESTSAGKELCALRIGAYQLLTSETQSCNALRLTRYLNGGSQGVVK
jgi:hypothetical protein